MAGNPPKKPLPPPPPPKTGGSPKPVPPAKPLPTPPNPVPVPLPNTASTPVNKTPPAKPLPPPPPPRVRVTAQGAVIAPKGYKLKPAKAGDCFCDFAAGAGFKDCTKIRAVNTHIADKAVLEPLDQVAMPEKTLENTNSPNETVVKAVRVMYPCAKVRFIGNGSSLSNRSAPGLTRLGVSNYRTDKSSATLTGIEADFFKNKGSDDDASRTAPELDTYADPDHFRIEIHDVAAKKAGKVMITAKLQVLQPLYVRGTNKVGKAIIKRDLRSRPDPNAPAGFKIPANVNRMSPVALHRVGDTAYYRSRYMRLITQIEDKIVGHTLFVGDYYDDGATEDEKRYTEILAQQVRVRYTPEMCTEKKCRVEAIADVGELLGEIRLNVHVMDGAVSNEEVRRVVYKQVRRVYASAHTRPYIRNIFRHPPPENILVIGDSAGTPAPAGVVGPPAPGPKMGAHRAPPPSKIKVKVEAAEIEEILSPRRTVASVATAIRQKITAAGFFVKELPNAYPVAAPLEPCVVYLVFKNAAMTDFAKISSATSDDARLSVANWALTHAKLGAFPHDGIFHRLLKAVCQTPVFDVIILKEFDTSGGDTLFGVATWWHQEFSPVVVVQSDRVTPVDDDRYTFSHEIAHVLCHGGHFSDAARQEQLMLQGSAVVGNAKDMPGRRRLQDAPMTMPYEAFDDAAGTWTGVNDLGPGKPHGTMVSRIHRFGKGPGFGPPTLEREVSTEW